MKSNGRKHEVLVRTCRTVYSETQMQGPLEPVGKFPLTPASTGSLHAFLSINWETGENICIDFKVTIKYSRNLLLRRSN